jgi:hypothetical protein
MFPRYSLSYGMAVNTVYVFSVVSDTVLPFLHIRTLYVRHRTNHVIIKK